MRQRGFTLIEMVMVVVLLAILVTVAWPKYFSLHRDGRIAILHSLQGSLNSISEQVYAKAAIQGVETLPQTEFYLTPSDRLPIKISYGYPVWSGFHLTTLLGISPKEWSWTVYALGEAPDADTPAPYEMRLIMRELSTEQCYLSIVSRDKKQSTSIVTQGC